MQTELQEKLTEVLTDVLEQFAFMFCEPTAPNPVPAPSGAMLRASMQFTGHSTGRLDVAAPQALAAEVAANALGIDEEEESAAAADDALRELLNIICGQILTAWAGEQPVFTLSIPHIAPCDDEAWQVMADDDRTVHFKVEDYPFLLRIEMPDLPEGGAS